MIEDILLTYIKQLVLELDIEENLEKDKLNQYTLSFSKYLKIHARTINEGFYFTAKLGTIPYEKSEEFFKYVLLANLFGQGTGGGVIGLTEDGKILELSYFHEEKLSYKQFRDIIEEFVNWVDMWQKKISDANSFVA
jgi:hypothetical protein